MENEEKKEHEHHETKEENHEHGHEHEKTEEHHEHYENHEKKEEHKEKEHEKVHHEQHEKKEENHQSHEHAHEKEGSEKEGVTEERRRQETPSGKGSAFKRESQLPVSSEKKDLRDSRISILVFTLAGAAMALLSSILKSSGLSSYIAVAPGFLVLVALLLGMQKAFRRRIKFFYASLFVCLLVWLVFWIFLYNM